MTPARLLRSHLQKGGLLVAPGACDGMTALKRSGVGPASKAGASLRETFRRFGTDEWDALRRPLPNAAD